MSTTHRNIPVVVLGAWCAVGPLSVAQAQQDTAVRFRPVDIYVDAGDQQLAAYQVELVVEEGSAQIVGVEGGEHAPFANPPYYDTRALMGGRIVLAAFSTAEKLPSGKQRLLTVHVREEGAEPRYALRLHAAADSSGQRINVELMVKPRDTAP